MAKLTPTMPNWRRYKIPLSPSLGTCCQCEEFKPSTQGIRGRNPLRTLDLCRNTLHEGIRNSCVHVLCEDCAVAMGWARP